MRRVENGDSVEGDEILIRLSTPHVEPRREVVARHGSGQQLHDPHDVRFQHCGRPGDIDHVERHGAGLGYSIKPLAGGRKGRGRHRRNTHSLGAKIHDQTVGTCRQRHRIRDNVESLERHTGRGSRNIDQLKPAGLIALGSDVELDHADRNARDGRAVSRRQDRTPDGSQTLGRNLRGREYGARRRKQENTDLHHPHATPWTHVCTVRSP